MESSSAPVPPESQPSPSPAPVIPIDSLRGGGANSAGTGGTHTEEEIRRYSEDQKAQISALKIDAKDWNGYRVTKIFSRNDEYVIYEIETDSPSESIKAYVHSLDIGDGKGREKNYEALRPELNEVKAVLYKAKRDTSCRQLIASAIATGIMGNTEAAKQALKDIKKRLDEGYVADFQSRTLYLLGTYVLCGLALLLGYAAYSMFGVAGGIPKALFVISFATIGGALSVSLRIKELELERDIDWRWIMLYGVERGVVALFCGLIMYLLLQGRIVFGFLELTMLPVLMLIVILAGFSEKLVPNILRNLETEEKRSAA
jgi:hypothetical protein